MTYDLVWADEWPKPWNERIQPAEFCWPWGAMRWVLPAMDRLGMTFDAQDVPAWPTDDFPVEEWDIEDPVCFSPARKAYEAAALLVTEARFESPGIPSHKFSSNDPWHIWPDEITSALVRYQERLPMMVWDEDWQAEDMAQFAAYLASAVEHGGCIVH